MVKKRREEKRIAEMHDLGRKNVETLAAARGWCKHLQIKMTSCGLLAEMSGLPIGSHDVTCPHTVSGMGGMNLPIILPEFVVQNCRGCTQHSPNGDTEWGDRVIAEYEARVKQAHERQALLDEQLEKVRASRRTLAREAQYQANFTVHRVLELTESLFDDDAEVRSAASVSLQQAAKIASELFHPVSVDLILTSASMSPLAELCLPIATAIAGRRDDLTDRLMSAAVESLDANLSVELACEILIGCGCGAIRPIPAGVIEKIVERQNHIRPIGGWPIRHPDCPLVDIPPTYAFSTSLLIRAYDQDPETMLAPLRAALRDNNKYRRVNVCGVVNEILNHRPAVGTTLLPTVLDSLSLDDDPYNESADHAACDLIGKIFLREPALTDKLLCDKLEQQSQEVQSLIGDAYRQVLRTELDGYQGLERGRSDLTVELALQRSLVQVQSQSLDLEVRQAFADAIESACHYHPDNAMTVFDTLLGALASLCAHEDPPAQPARIILPGDPPPDPMLRGLEQANRRQHWDHLKNTIAKCLKELSKKLPKLAAERLLGCFASLDSKTHERFKSTVVTLLGEVGAERELLPRVLPLLWKALMDYDSTLVRRRGIEAVTRCFENADCDPPSDVVEALVLHLRDTFVIVHDAAIRAIGWHTRWLVPAQIEDVINQLVGWAVTYRKKNPHKLEDICRPILFLSLSIPAMRYNAVRFVADLLPTEDSHVDGELVELLIRDVNPEEEGASCVAIQVAAWLGRHRRDPFDYRDEALNETYNWLRSLSRESFQVAREALVAAGRAVAQRGDVWSTFRFAAVFASFADFRTEADLLGSAKGRLPAGRRNEQAIQFLGDLEQAAKANEQLTDEE